MSSEIKVDTISENTSANGVAIDSLGIKDGKITNLMNGTLSAADLGVGVHIKSADSSASASVHADELVIENSANAGLSVLSGTSNTGSIFFGDSGDNDIGYIQYEHGSTNALYFGTNAGTRMVIDSTGAVTKPAQPAFQVRGASNVTNYSINTTHDVVFGTEVFDQNADISSNTFTAPVTGRYILNTSLYLINADSGADYHQLDLVTSNRNNYAIVGSNVLSADSNYFSINITVLADMDANDTAKVQYYQSGGAATTDSSGVGSWFSGHLAC